jgi:hypothetical protein
MKKIYTDDQIISGFLINFRTGDASYFWAYEEVCDLISTNPEHLWLITLEMIKQATDEETLAYIAAVPLEDLLAYHGDIFIERIEHLASIDPHFCSALASVYGQIRFKPEIYSRVQIACKNKKQM